MSRIFFDVFNTKTEERGATIEKSNDNIAIFGQVGSGKTLLLKSTLIKSLECKKKVMVLEHENEYRQITAELDGKYSCFEYDNVENIECDSDLTTITFAKAESKERNVENLLKIINVAIKNKIKTIFIDEYFYYLEECKKVLDYIEEESIQLIVCSQFESFILESKENRESFKRIFKTIIVMQSNMYVFGQYQKLLDLYNIKEPGKVIEEIKNKERGEVIRIKDKEIRF